MATSDGGFIDVPGGRLHYQSEGSGAPLLLIHGGLGSLRMWDDVVPTFARHHRVIRYDTRGFGRSETDAVAFSNRADAAAVLEHVGVTTAAVVGQSRGAIIGLDVAIERPELVDALVLVAGGASGLEPEFPEGVEPAPWGEMDRLFEAKDWEALAELETRVWVDGWGHAADRVDGTVRRRVHDWILENYRAEREEGRPQPLDPPAAGRLGEVLAPTLVLVGTADEPGTIMSGRHIAASMRDARLVEFEGVAHMIHLEEPERFASVVLAFLEGKTIHSEPRV